MFQPESVRGDFPILELSVNSHPLIYLDNAATTQMPEPVLATYCEQHRLYEANVHRGIHRLSQLSTKRMEEARVKVQRFLNARYPEEIIFTSGTTAGINLVAESFGRAFLNPGDEIIVTNMEHHSNLVPWQETCRRHEAALKIWTMEANGSMDVNRLAAILSPKTKMVAVCGVSNVVGTLNPLDDIVKLAHAVGAFVLVDAAQAIRHGRTNVQELFCDFLVFSGHKIMGPTGTGVLYGRRDILEKLPPVVFGGGMVDRVTETSASFESLPFKFEAGTPNIAGIIALGEALEYVQRLGIGACEHERNLIRYLEQEMREIPEVELVGSPRFRVGVLSFNLQGFSAFDTAALLDKLGIAVRSGHHCAQPALRHFGLEGAVRVSPAFYNTKEEMEAFLDGLRRVIPLLKGTKT